MNDSNDMTGVLDLIMSRNNSKSDSILDNKSRYNDMSRSLSIPSINNIGNIIIPQHDENQSNEKAATLSDDGYNDYNLEDEEDELIILPTNNNQDDKLLDRYKSALSKPILTVGSIDISMGKGKLYGLLDENNEVKLPHIITNVNELINKKSLIDKVTQLHTRRTFIPPIDENEIDKSKTINANPSATVDRLTNPANDSKSIFINGVRYTKAQLDSMELDYQYKSNKNQCPQCKKFQSFSEYMEKKKMCLSCNLRYEKLNISTGTNYYKQVKLLEEKKQQKIKQIENEIYGEMERKRNPKKILIR